MATAARVVVAHCSAAVDVKTARLTAGLPAGRATAVPVRARAALPTTGAVRLACAAAMEVLPGAAQLRQQQAAKEDLPQGVAAVTG